jgi:hypothetical protein
MKRKEKAKAPQSGANGQMPWDEAVAEGQALVKEKNQAERRIQMRLGELAERVEKKYADRTIFNLAEKIGISDCTLHRYHSVYMAWDGMGIVAPGPVSYSVLKELKDQHDREKLVNDKPHMTRRDAEQLVRERGGKNTKKKSGDWKRDEIRRWLRRFCSFVNDVAHTAEQMQHDEEMARALLEAWEPKLLADLKRGAAAFLWLVECLEHTDEPSDLEEEPKHKGNGHDVKPSHIGGHA